MAAQTSAVRRTWKHHKGIGGERNSDKEEPQLENGAGNKERQKVAKTGGSDNGRIEGASLVRKIA